MTQMSHEVADFTYDTPSDPSGLPARVAIFADRGRMREEIAADLGEAGFRTIDGGEIAHLLDGPIALLGDAVMIDCPNVNAETLAALARLDMRVAQAGAQLIVSTAMEALDDVFGALNQSDPQILVQPTRADRLLAVGRVLADIGDARVREMTEADRLNLLHLSRQVESIASKLEGLTGDEVRIAEGRNPSEIGNVNQMRGRPGSHGCDRTEPTLPAPARVREIIAARHARARFFDGELFSDPAWDMLLDLTAAHGEGQRVSVTSLCIAANVPATTALRWLKQMVDSGLFVRGEDPSDRRRAFIALSASSLDAMSRYFEAIETPWARAA